MGTRRQLSREFKVEAVKLVKERGVSVAQAARDLELHQTVLRSWIRELAADPQQAFPAGDPAMKRPEVQMLPDTAVEMRKLRRRGARHPQFLRCL